MHRSTETARERFNRRTKQYERLAEVLQMSKAMQRRYRLIPQSALNKVTVAGVRDMTLGRVKDGQPVGANVIRFNNPSPGTQSNYHRICIDPNGVSNRANPHIRVSPGTIKAAERIQKVLKVSGKVTLVVSIIAAGFRIGKAIYDEIDIDSEIEALRGIVDSLREDLKDDSLMKERARIRESLEFAESLLEDALDCKRNPGKKTLLCALCTGGEWAGAAALAYMGATAGATVGTVGGPVGSIAGAVTGGIVGAVAGTELGASAVQNFRVDDDGMATEMQGSLVNIDENVKVLNVDGNVFLGKGVEVGARATMGHFTIDDERSIDVGKAGANFGISNKGVDVGVESKVIWAERDFGHAKMGAGLNLDTGFEVSERRAQFSVLGFGFSGGQDGFGIKTPFWSIKWK